MGAVRAPRIASGAAVMAPGPPFGRPDPSSPVPVAPRTPVGSSRGYEIDAGGTQWVRDLDGNWTACADAQRLSLLLGSWALGDGPILAPVTLLSIAGTARGLRGQDPRSLASILLSTGELLRHERSGSAAMAAALSATAQVLADDGASDVDELAERLSDAAGALAAGLDERLASLARRLALVGSADEQGVSIVIGHLGLDSVQPVPAEVAGDLLTLARSGPVQVSDGGASRIGTRLARPSLAMIGVAADVLADVDVPRLLAWGRVSRIVVQTEGATRTGDLVTAAGGLSAAVAARERHVPVAFWAPVAAPAVSPVPRLTAVDPISSAALPSYRRGARSWPLDIIPSALAREVAAEWFAIEAGG